MNPVVTGPARMIVPRVVATIGVLLTVAACSEDRGPYLIPDGVETIEAPAVERALGPNLTVGLSGRLYMTWLEGSADRTIALKLTTLDSTGWTAPQTIALGSDWIANSADFPVLTELSSGTIAAHYLQRAGGGGYEIRVVQSIDGGATWSVPVTPHRDQAPAEHGFVSLFPLDAESTGIIWLDGRSFTPEFGGTGETSLRFTTLEANGVLGQDSALDERVCDCCQTAVATTSSGPVVVYRDRSESEVRDIYISRHVEGVWTEGQPVNEDNWKIEGCPVDGPAISSDGRQRVAVAWFTGAGDTARVKVAFSEDGGAAFGSPIQADQGVPLGKVDVELLPDGSALVSWMEGTEDGGARLVARQIRSDGSVSDITQVTESTVQVTGFPRMALIGNTVVFVWTESASSQNLRTARVTLRTTDP